MNNDRIRERLGSGEVAYGIAVSWPDPDLVEAAGTYGFDFAFIDAEHDALDVRTCVELVRAAECGGMSSFVRVPYGDIRGVYRYLDMGVHGLIFPHVASVSDAKAAVKACLFPPDGLRGATSLSRATEYGAAAIPQESYQTANDALWVLPVIEDVEGIGALDEILALPGIRGFFVGPGDLAQSRLATGNEAYPSVDIMVNRAISTGARLGKVVGTDALTPGAAADLVAKGVRMIVVGAASLFRRSCLDYLNSMPRRAPMRKEKALD